MAGNLNLKRGSTATLTTTNLQSLASSSTFLAGWTSNWIDTTTNNAFDMSVGGQITAGTTPTAGSIRIYAYAEFDGTNVPSIFSAGTAGTEGTATVNSSRQLDASLILLWSSDVSTTTNEVFAMPNRSLRSAFGGVLPRKVALFVAHNTVAALKSSGSAIYTDEEYAQYT